MARLAAGVWIVVGAVVLLAGLVELPGRIGEILGGYGVSDARMMLLASGLAILAGAGALAAGLRWWRGGRGAHWPVVPAMAFLANALVFLDGRVGKLFEHIVFAASPFWLLYFGIPMVLGGIALTALVSVLDKLAGSLLRRRG